MKSLFLLSLMLGLTPTASASFNNTRDIYCKPQSKGTCTLTLHLGASFDKLQDYWNRLALLNSTEGSSSTRTNRTSHGHHNHTHSKTNMTLSGTYYEILKFLSQEANNLKSKRDVIRHTHAHNRHRYSNSSRFLGDLAMIHDHQCNPLSRIPTANLSDNSVVNSSLSDTLKFMLYQPGNTHGSPSMNFIFEYANQTYHDLIATDAGLKQGKDHPCACLSPKQRCPDGSDRCCSCRFSC